MSFYDVGRCIIINTFSCLVCKSVLNKENLRLFKGCTHLICRACNGTQTCPHCPGATELKHEFLESQIFQQIEFFKSRCNDSPPIQHEPSHLNGTFDFENTIEESAIVRRGIRARSQHFEDIEKPPRVSARSYDKPGDNLQDVVTTPLRPSEKRYSRRSTPRPSKFAKGDFVLAKVRGYSWWPAKVTAINGRTVHVKFYGDGAASAAVNDKFTKIYEPAAINLASIKLPHLLKAHEQIAAAMARTRSPKNKSFNNTASMDSSPKSSFKTTPRNSSRLSAVQKVALEKLITDDSTKEKDNAFWENVAKTLNNMGGAIKDGRLWKRSYNDLLRVRRNASSVF